MAETTQQTGAEARRTLHEAIGGTEKIRELVERFYDIMDSDLRAAGIRTMHPQDLTGSREKLFMYLTGWSGGPQLYVERYGHPRLRARHLPFSIGEHERDQLMYCMIKALHDVGVEPDLLQKTAQALWDMADFMRNKAE
jgi:hemoglobin